MLPDVRTITSEITGQVTEAVRESENRGELLPHSTKLMIDFLSMLSSDLEVEKLHYTVQDINEFEDIAPGFWRSDLRPYFLEVTEGMRLLFTLEQLPTLEQFVEKVEEVILQRQRHGPI